VFSMAMTAWSANDFIKRDLRIREGLDHTSTASDCANRHSVPQDRDSEKGASYRRFLVTA